MEPTTNPLDRIDQIDAMRLGVDYRVKVVCRGFTMYVRPLSIQEQVQVAANVQEKYENLAPMMRNLLSEHSLLAQESLIMASTSEPGKNDQKITELIFAKMTPGEIQHLYKQYISAVDKANPSLEFLSKDELNGIIEALKKSPNVPQLESALIGLSFMESLSLARHFLIPGE